MSASQSGYARPDERPSWRERFVVEERYLSPAARRNLYRLSAVLITVGVAAFTLLMVGVLTHSGFERLDRPVEQWFDARRNPGTTGVMIVLAVVFGPVALPIIIAVVLVAWVLLARHLWRPLILAGGMLTGVVLAQVLAPIVRHPRPPIGLMLFGPDHTFSFPSGHVLGTSDLFLIVAFLLASRIRRTWFTVLAIVVAVSGIAAQVSSRLYLGYHWISDTTGSIALSMVIVGVVIAIDTRRTVRVPGEPVTGEFSALQKDGT
jgi:membrane-associated phospholipid phosphatase